ncbi:hypothetical protein L7F22_050496 [Adiantum nelumboides]|nr:hypothetical protein [Adiantum nelumboides]
MAPRAKPTQRQGSLLLSMQQVIRTFAHLGSLCKTKQFDQALAIACSMDQQGISISRDIIYSLLQGHACSKDPTCAKQLHVLMVHNKLDRVPVLADHLIRLFVSCDCFDDAEVVFSRISKPSVYTWNAILTAHSQSGSIDAVFEALCKMLQSGLKPDRVTMLCVLRACSNTGSGEKGRLAHEGIIRSDVNLDLILGSALVDMYAKCGNLEDAKKILVDLPNRDIVSWGALIAGYAQHDDGLTALHLFYKMQAEGVCLNEVIFPSVLKACGVAATIEEGRISHSQIAELGFDRDLVVLSSLVDMYSRCKSIEDAQQLFDNAFYRDSVLWGTMVAGYAYCGYDQSAIDTFKDMLTEGLVPSIPMLLCVMKAANSLGASRQVRALHDLLIRVGAEQDLVLGNALIDVYGKCASLGEAQRVFNCMQRQDVVSWATLMAAYEEQGDCKAVIELFFEMQENGISPDRVVILSTLKACAGSGNIHQGRTLQQQLNSWGVALDLVISNAFIDMYSKCGSLEEARIIFDKLKCRDEISWGAMISGYADDGNAPAALELANEMLEEGQNLGKVVLLSTLKACSNLSALLDGKLLHNHAVKNGLASDLDIGSTLIKMYSKCGCLKDATKLFDLIPNCNVTAWTAVILAYADCGDGTAIELFAKMQDEGISFSASILLGIVEACGGINDIIEGRIMHHQVLKHGLDSNATVTNLLIGMYAKCQSITEARQVFDTFKYRDKTTWGTIIAAYIHNGDDPVPLNLLQESEDVISGHQVLICILKACSSRCLFELGRVGHFLAVETGLEADILIGSTLINLYAKCRSLQDALRVFEQLPSHDLITYSTMITGLVEFDEHFLALELYVRLQHEDFKADKHIQQCMLRVCGILNFIRHGRLIHDEVVKNELDCDVEISSALVDMYTNCASLEEAHKVFYSISNPNASLWSALITGYTYHGHCKQALQCTEDMGRQGLNPTVRMFSSILAACSHAGALMEGNCCFRIMTEKYNILPSIEHLNCMIDLFGRAGHLDMATDLLTAMPTCPDVVGWKSLLTGCRMYGLAELGNIYFDEAAVLQPNNSSLSGKTCTEDAEIRKAWKLFDDGSEDDKAASVSNLDPHMYRELHTHTVYGRQPQNKEAQSFTPQCEDNHLENKDGVFWSLHLEKYDDSFNFKTCVQVPS